MPECNFDGNQTARVSRRHPGVAPRNPSAVFGQTHHKRFLVLLLYKRRSPAMTSYYEVLRPVTPADLDAPPSIAEVMKLIPQSGTVTFEAFRHLGKDRATRGPGPRAQGGGAREDIAKRSHHESGIGQILAHAVQQVRLQEPRLAERHRPGVREAVGKIRRVAVRPPLPVARKKGSGLPGRPKSFATWRILRNTATSTTTIRGS